MSVLIYICIHAGQKRNLPSTYRYLLNYISRNPSSFAMVDTYAKRVDVLHGDEIMNRTEQRKGDVSTMISRLLCKPRRV